MVQCVRGKGETAMGKSLVGEEEKISYYFPRVFRSSSRNDSSSRSCFERERSERKKKCNITKL